MRLLLEGTPVFLTMFTKLYVVTLFLFSDVLGISIDELYPFGPEHGDTRVPPLDDESTSPVPIQNGFPFFNKQHDFLIVSKTIFIEFCPF